jgi:hypothetical protein
MIENNEFAMGTRLEYHAADPELWKRGLPFGIECERIDGMDVLQSARDAKRIVDKVRRDGKPYLVEVMNYRFAGHGAADNDRQLYRTKEEEEAAYQRDPLKRLETLLLEHNVMTREKMQDLRGGRRQSLPRPERGVRQRLHRPGAREGALRGGSDRLGSHKTLSWVFSTPHCAIRPRRLYCVRWHLGSLPGTGSGIGRRTCWSLLSVSPEPWPRLPRR